ncbi:MAG: non-homologous end-joining DNA ligase [Hyphomicrobiales bacterium]|nr:non-homologous end-joining DNA ligase [Hyphomicrobiales bacterium]
MAKSLVRYRAKRDFSTTPEPMGGERGAHEGSPRFVIHKHDATRLHYDLRLEFGGVFKSWAVPNGPSLDPLVKRLAVEVENHPLEYGDFEGTIPAGEYGGGTVMIWDRGYWMPAHKKSIAQSLRDGELTFIADGSRFNGSWILVRMPRRHGEKRNNWLLMKRRDAWAKDGDQPGDEDARSIASGRTMEQIAGGRGPAAKPFMFPSGRAKAKARTEPGPAKAPPRRIASVPAEGNRIEGVTISNPEKELWPKSDLGPPVTKIMLARYLASVAPWIIEHIGGWPCSLLRAPDGIGGQHFFQRHAAPSMRRVAHVDVGDGEKPYLQIDDARGLVSMGQLAALEFHPWNAAVGAPNVPGRLVFDLDPAEDLAFSKVIDAALEMRARLKRLGLVSFCKTTGGKGLHVVVPLDASKDPLDWTVARTFARTVAMQMAEDTPRRYLTSMSIERRKGRLFIDWLRNDRTATAVAPLSPRARAGATVSMPLEWGQVENRLDPKAFTIHTVAEHLRTARAWRSYGEAARPLKQAVDKLLQRGS